MFCARKRFAASITKRKKEGNIMQKRVLTVALSLLLAIALAAPVGLAETAPAQTGVLEVHGQAQISVVPDTVSLRLGANIDHKDEKEAYSRANAIMNGVLEALRALGVPENQMKTGALNITRQYDYSKSPYVLRGYTANVSLTVTLHDFEQINTVIDTAVAKGANDVGGMQFSYADESAVYRQALCEAIQAARAKAEAMAGAAGVSLGGLLKMVEGGQMGYGYATNYYAAPMETAKPDGAQVVAGEIQISANVDMTFETK